MIDSKFEDDFDKVILKAMYHFEDEIVERYNEDCTCFDGETIEWTYGICMTTKYEIVINDPYWVKYWSTFLVCCLMDTVQ